MDAGVVTQGSEDRQPTRPAGGLVEASLQQDGAVVRGSRERDHLTARCLPEIAGRRSAQLIVSLQVPCMKASELVLKNIEMVSPLAKLAG